MKSKFQTSSLTTLNDSELILSTRNVVAVEHAATTNVVRHFAEIFRRRTHAVLGYSSMFQLAVEEFGYDKASAQRRVNAMWLALDVPEVLTLIDEKRICLQAAADIQTFLNKERGARTPYTPQQKAKLVETCSRKSTREVQRHLASLNPQCDFKESKGFVSADRLQITYTVSTAIEGKLDRLKEILAHVNPYISREDLIDYIAEIALDKLDPIRKAERATKRAQKVATAVANEASSGVANEHANGSSAKVGQKSPQNTESEVSLVPAQKPILAVVRNSNVLEASEGAGEAPVQFFEVPVGSFGEIQFAVDFCYPSTGRVNAVRERLSYYESDSQSARWSANRGTAVAVRPCEGSLFGIRPKRLHHRA